MFTNHNFGDKKCTSISQQDRNQYESSKLSNMTDYTKYNDADELAEMLGYRGNIEDNSSSENEEVVNKKISNFTLSSCRPTNAKIVFIQPVPSQILTVFENVEDTMPIHIDLDSGATLNYCTEKKSNKLWF